MYFKFTSAAEVPDQIIARELKRTCRNARSIDELLVWWPGGSRYFVIYKRFDDLTGEPKIILEFFDEDTLIGIGKTSLADFVAHGSPDSSLTKMVTALQDEALKCCAPDASETSSL